MQVPPSAYLCRYCGCKRYNLSLLDLHEDVCEKNPANGGAPVLPKSMPTSIPSPSQPPKQLTAIQQEHLAKGGRLCAKCGMPLLLESIKDTCGLCETKAWWERWKRRWEYWR